MMNSTEKSLPEKLSDDIIAYILEEQLQPNDKLPNESVLSEKMGAGRSSIREAMKLLASRNIVTIRQGSGTYVAASPGVVDDPLGFTFIDDKKKLTLDLLDVRFLLGACHCRKWQPCMPKRPISARSLRCVMKSKHSSFVGKITLERTLSFTLPLP